MDTPQTADIVTTTGEGRAWLWALGCTLCGWLLLYALVQRTTLLVPDEPWLTMWLELAVLGTVGALLLTWVCAVPRTVKYTLAVGGVSLFLTFIVMATLKATPYTLDALSGDQGLYTAYVTKFAAYPGNVDAIYADLPTFYPPLYFYVLGRLAAWLQLAPYTLLKLGLLAATLVLPFLLSWSWRRLVALPLAAAAAFTLLVEQQWYKPAEWLTMVLFVPWWLHWVENCTEDPVRTWSQKLRWWLIGGLIGAVIFQTYYYWFFVGGISLLLQVVRNLWQPTRRQMAWALVRNAVPMLISTAFFSALYWAPYLFSMVRQGGWRVLQNRWIAQGKLTLPLPFADDTFGAGILLLGLLYLALMAHGNRVMRSLLYFLVATYGWLALGYGGMVADAPLLTFRAYPLVTYVPALGVAFAVAQLWQQGTTLIPFGVTSMPVGRVVATLAMVLVLFFAQNTVLTWQKNEDVPKAVAMTYPAAQIAALDTAIGTYENKTVLLSRDYADWIAYRPFFAFLAWSAHYSHPAAHFYDRLDLLERLSMVHTPRLFAAALWHNRYERIDHLLLRTTDGGWRLSFLDDNFPNRNVQRILVFAAENLAPPYFTATAAGELTLLTPDYAVEPMAALNGKVANAPLADVALLSALANGFGRHLADVDTRGLQHEVDARLHAADLSLLSTAELLDLYQFSAQPLREQAYRAFIGRLTAVLDQPLTDQLGVPKLQLIGYSVEQGGAEQSPVLALYAEVLAPLDWDYTIWLHAFTDSGKSTLDFSPMQPSTSWFPGQVVRLQRTLALAPGTYDLQLGLWRSEEDVRLVLPAGDIGVSLGAVTVP